jgi:hypothetical protein
MLYGDKQQVQLMIKEALYSAAFFAWDVVKPSPSNTAAQEELKCIIDAALEDVDVTVVPCEYPLHGKLDINKLAGEVIPKLCATYGKQVLTKKQKTLTSVFKARLELSFNSVPRTKGELKKKHPELFPVIRRRKS